MPFKPEIVQLIIAVAAGMGGTIGGIIIALRRAMRPVEQQVTPTPPVEVTLYHRVEEIADKVDALPGIVRDCEARVIERIAEVDKTTARLDERVKHLEEKKGGRR